MIRPWSHEEETPSGALFTQDEWLLNHLAHWKSHLFVSTCIMIIWFLNERRCFLWVQMWVFSPEQKDLDSWPTMLWKQNALDGEICFLIGHSIEFHHAMWHLFVRLLASQRDQVNVLWNDQKHIFFNWLLFQTFSLRAFRCQLHEA